MTKIHPDEMTEAEETAFNAAVEDPSIITTESEALEIIAGLDYDIQDIRAQLDAAKIERETCGLLSSERRDWVRRASLALGLKIRQRGAVSARLGELRPPPVAHVPETKSPPFDKEIAQLVAKTKNKGAEIELAKLRVQQEEAIRLRKAEEAVARERIVKLANSRQESQYGLFVAWYNRTHTKDETRAAWASAQQMFPTAAAWNETPAGDGV